MTNTYANDTSLPELNQRYWAQRYEQRQTGWDIGHASPPIIRYMSGIADRSQRILIPGAGRAYEAVWLHQHGFAQVWVCDWVASAFEHLRRAAPDFPAEHILVADFFQLQQAFDLILEQTFFCAIDPALRPDYVRQAAQLLRPGGILAGLLFAEHFEQPGPPFGGVAQEYRLLFSPFFDILHMDIAPDSIAPRAGRELFVEMRKR